MSDEAKPEVWYAHWQQKGDGCDYTIGCGHRFLRLEATDRESAEREALDRYHTVDSSRTEFDYYEIGQLRIFRVVEEHDLAAGIAARRREWQAANEAVAKAAKRKQLEALKAELSDD